MELVLDSDDSVNHCRDLSLGGTWSDLCFGKTHSGCCVKAKLLPVDVQTGDNCKRQWWLGPGCSAGEVGGLGFRIYLERVQ